MPVEPLRPKPAVRFAVVAQYWTATVKLLQVDKITFPICEIILQGQAVDTDYSFRGGCAGSAVQRRATEVNDSPTLSLIENVRGT
jgi:hypothetical protein